MAEEQKTNAVPAPNGSSGQADNPPKKKKVLSKSRIMVGEQLTKLYQDTVAAKERGEKIGWSASIFPRKSQRQWGFTLCIRRIMQQGLQQDTRRKRI